MTRYNDKRRRFTAGFLHDDAILRLESRFTGARVYRVYAIRGILITSDPRNSPVRWNSIEHFGSLRLLDATRLDYE